jgi:hypothetical protein
VGALQSETGKAVGEFVNGFGPIQDPGISGKGQAIMKSANDVETERVKRADPHCRSRLRVLIMVQGPVWWTAFANGPQD